MKYVKNEKVQLMNRSSKLFHEYINILKYSYSLYIHI